MTNDASGSRHFAAGAENAPIERPEDAASEGSAAHVEEEGFAAPPDPESEAPVHDRMLREVGIREGRKLRARQEGTRSAWFGLGMFGMVGWSVALPTVLGVALGVWIDRKWPGPYSWTLMLLLGGMALGCFSAWRWVSREREEIERRDPDTDDDR